MGHCVTTPDTIYKPTCITTAATGYRTNITTTVSFVVALTPRKLKMSPSRTFSEIRYDKRNLANKSTTIHQ
jgi:hypothetical protein